VDVSKFHRAERPPQRPPARRPKAVEVEEHVE
jgi:hypothetical protein